MEDRRRAKLIQPFYSKMMWTNAVEHGAELQAAVITVGRTTTAGEVIALLHDGWRSAVMGAWFALFHGDEVTEALLHALVSSNGRLDSPPLATAAVVIAGTRAVPALEEYALKDAALRLGACGFAAAAIEHLLVLPLTCEPNAEDRHDFGALLTLAEGLRAAR